jgi:uncharacterized membrane protein YcaP (DUF421 family)
MDLQVIRGIPAPVEFRLVIVLIADAAQNAMANDYKCITEGTLLVLTMAVWNFVLDWLGYPPRGVQGLGQMNGLVPTRNGARLSL